MKAGTFTQMYVQVVFAVKNRNAGLYKANRSRIFEYISGIITNMGHKSIIVNGSINHVHILIGLHPSMSVAETVHGIKRNSTLFINRERLCPSKFEWQDGYGGFTYSKSQLDDVYKYIENQELHHKKITFREEYIGFLQKFEIDYDDRFLFDFWEEDESVE